MTRLWKCIDYLTAKNTIPIAIGNAKNAKLYFYIKKKVRKD